MHRVTLPLLLGLTASALADDTAPPTPEAHVFLDFSCLDCADAWEQDAAELLRQGVPVTPHAFPLAGACNARSHSRSTPQDCNTPKTQSLTRPAPARGTTY